MATLAVVDTNVLVSALLKPRSLPARVAQALRHGTLVPVVCRGIVDEYRAVLVRPKLRLPTSDVQELLGLIEQQAVWVHIGADAGLLRLPDRDDWPFIASALAAGCPVVTGNARHFPARLGVQVNTVRELIDKLAGGEA